MYSIPELKRRKALNLNQNKKKAINYVSTNEEDDKHSEGIIQDCLESYNQMWNIKAARCS
jgi:hypothetical protein